MTWRYCEGLINGGLHVLHVRRADKSGLCNWCRKRIREEPAIWKRVPPVGKQVPSEIPASIQSDSEPNPGG